VQEDVLSAAVAEFEDVFLLELDVAFGLDKFVVEVGPV
jgi:hypothetical protein